MKAIVTKYLPATNYRPSRIKASDCDGNSVTIPYDSASTDGAAFAKAAVALCHKMGWTYGGKLISGGMSNGYVFVFEKSDSFEV